MGKKKEKAEPASAATDKKPKKKIKTPLRIASTIEYVTTDEFTSMKDARKWIADNAEIDQVCVVIRTLASFAPQPITTRKLVKQ